ncbi:translocation and assembly module lipoprotein TamL [Flavobacterium branchiophilum]|uniref:Bacterial surface antigen (D15) domain-containing protein n=1 Tax=Flavobacterium branchiophilum TaxID=55197 RepID=A0A2H3KLU6_9FLAO|nr:BamA/TamA family outer membrane protein [Flavobacterium branchiophilum]PDS24208.1 hypothetical protein B0A77_08720 [Flavobacterium branchiophilum]
MRNTATKISFFILIGLFLWSCNATKRVPEGKLWLIKNEFIVDGQPDKSEALENLAYQKPNSAILGFPLRLQIYNLARQNPDSIYLEKLKKKPKKWARIQARLAKKGQEGLGNSFWNLGIHRFLKKNGEAPVVLDVLRTNRTLKRINAYYDSQGYFRVKSTFKLDTLEGNKAKISYIINKGTPYVIDTIKTTIKTPVLDSLYRSNMANSFLKKQQYNLADLDAERSRITNLFRNNGAFHFQQNYIVYVIDTVDNNKKVNINLIINDRSIRVNDSSKTVPFKLFKINKINVFTDAASAKKSDSLLDSLVYKRYTIFSHGKLKFTRKSITSAIFLSRNKLFSDDNTTLTTRYLNSLGSFKSPSIQYVESENDTIPNSLTANIFLTQKDKYGFKTTENFTHSNIQDFGITATQSLVVRNLFKGSELLQIALRGNIGSSKNLANPNERFFNVSEYGIDFKLKFPRILFPFKTDKIIPKSMLPSTVLSVGFTKQNNIGLDKESFSGSYAYNWTPKKNVSARFELFNIQYINNLNTNNYFNVYRSSYGVMNDLARKYQTDPSYFDSSGNLILENGLPKAYLETNLIDYIVQNETDYKILLSIFERRERIIQNDLILSSSFSYLKSSRLDNADNNYYTIRTKIESAGNLLSLLSNKNLQPIDENGSRTIFGVAYTQYLKGELEYIKNWDLRGQKVLAIRTFFGLGMPYGNSKSIPFSRSYFGGGSNDNRGWLPYSLGAGKANSFYDFNVANMKMSLNSELRFNIYDKWNGALFVDVGNIWNLYNTDYKDDTYFYGFKSLKDVAVGSGFGIRYDLTYFVVRLDFGYKTYNPANESDKRWFTGYNLSKTILNIGINYPF